jgi:hypothetical protein
MRLLPLACYKSLIWMLPCTIQSKLTWCLSIAQIKTWLLWLWAQVISNSSWFSLSLLVKFLYLLMLPCSSTEFLELPIANVVTGYVFTTNCLLHHIFKAYLLICSVGLWRMEPRLLLMFGKGDSDSLRNALRQQPRPWYILLFSRPWRTWPEAPQAKPQRSVSS